MGMAGERGAGLGWVSIVRLGLVQAAIGSVVVLTTSTFNRVMTVELALPALLPGLLVGLHYGVQLTRPHWGFRSDARGGRTPFVVGGVALLALGGLMAAASVALLQDRLGAGVALGVAAYAAIGLGVGAAGTSLLALLATATEPRRRAAAATITWLMMIAGIAVTAVVAGGRLDPYSHARLIAVTAAVGGGALALTVLAVAGIERRLGPSPAPEPERGGLREGLAEVWSEPDARRFTVFVFLSMTAYFMQELILEPYAGRVFGFTPGASTQLSGAQNGGVFLGMVAVALAASGLGLGSLRAWVVGGCLGSAASLVAIAAVGGMPGAPLTPAVMALGFFNGVFAVAAIGSMMQLAGRGRARREGTRMGLWGAAQAIAAGAGGLLGTALVDVLRLAVPDPAAFGTVFLIEAALFGAAAILAVRAVARPAAIPGE